METDDEASSVDEHYEPRFASVARSGSLSRPSNKRQRKLQRRGNRNSTGSTSGVSSAGSIAADGSEANSDIFFIYNPIVPIEVQPQKQSSVHDHYKKSRFRSKATLDLHHPSSNENEIELGRVPSISTFDLIEPVNYSKHTNLEVQDLSFKERIHLARIHYLTIPNGIRLALVLFCLGWFIFNAVTIFKMYLDYNTIVYMEYKPPKLTQPPVSGSRFLVRNYNSISYQAISICTSCFLCGYSNKLLEQLSVTDVVKSPDDENNAYASVEGYVTQMHDISIKCHYLSTTIPNLLEERIVKSCSEIVPFVVSLQEGRKCWTFFSDLQGQMTRVNASNDGLYQLEFERFPMIVLQISGRLLTDPPGTVPPPDDTTNETRAMIESKKASKATSGIYIALHDPTQLSYMQDIPMHRIQPGKDMDVRFQKKIENLLEPPFSTNCFRYDPMLDKKPNTSDSNALTSPYPITRSGLGIYRSRGECFLYCIYRTLNRNQCINIYSIFLYDLVENVEFKLRERLLKGDIDMRHLNENELNDNGKIQFCARNNRSLSDYLSRKQQCLDQCNQACHVETFNIDPNVLDYDGNNDSQAQMRIQWAPEQYTYISHKEKLDLNEFLGTLGGHAHIWLGLSVIHIIRYVLHLFKTGEFLPETSCCCIIFWWKSFIYSRNRFSN